MEIFLTALLTASLCFNAFIIYQKRSVKEVMQVETPILSEEEQEQQKKMQDHLNKMMNYNPDKAIGRRL